MSHRNFLAVLAFAALLIPAVPAALNAHPVEPEPKPKPGSVWRDDTPININLQFSSTDTYVAINDKYPLYAYAHDGDEFWCEEGEEPYWADWHDNVTSGTTAADHHVWWEASEGIFDNPYGTSVLYRTPDYDPGCASGVRDVTITVRARDEGPPNCWNDPDAVASGVVQVWQVTVTKKQSDSVSQENDMEGLTGDPPHPGEDHHDRIPVSDGGEQLGWVAYNAPAGCRKYGGNTELMGSIPNVPPHFQTYVWVSEKLGGTWYKDPDHPEWEKADSHNYYVWIDDSPYVEWQDMDCRHPNGPGNDDVYQVFMYDWPGFPSGPSNANGIPPWTDYKYDLDFRSHVTIWSNAFSKFIRVSNILQWEVYFELKKDGGGQWEVQGSHIP